MQKLDNTGMTCKDQGNGKYLIKAPRTNGFYTIRVFATDDDRVSTLTRDIHFAVTPLADVAKKKIMHGEHHCCPCIT
ncbi:MAG: hypothetical protein II593_07530 [Prevotella sp.]|nr:hypothetical protein [Prevotella sp.]